MVTTSRWRGKDTTAALAAPPRYLYLCVVIIKHRQPIVGGGIWAKCCWDFPTNNIANMNDTITNGMILLFLVKWFSWEAEDLTENCVLSCNVYVVQLLSYELILWPYIFLANILRFELEKYSNTATNAKHLWKRRQKPNQQTNHIWCRW